MTTTTENKQSKTWVIAAAALVAFVGVIIWVLARPSVPADEVATEPPGPPPTAAPSSPTAAKPSTTAAAKVAPAAPTKAEPAPRPLDEEVDLFAEPMPDFMVDLHARVLDKKWLNVHQQKELYKWGQEHKNDARPQLLLAWDSRNRDWDGMGINVYGIAFRADPRAATASNLRDLVDMASEHLVDRVEFTDTIDIVKAHFGVNAIPVIDELIEKFNESGDIVRATRLSYMRDQIRGR